MCDIKLVFVVIVGIIAVEKVNGLLNIKHLNVPVLSGNDVGSRAESVNTYNQYGGCGQNNNTQGDACYDEVSNDNRQHVSYVNVRDETNIKNTNITRTNIIDNK